jgi:hypothetical protein
LAVSPVHARVLRVAADGVGPDGASWASAYPTISRALFDASRGDEVWVAQGAYPETVTLVDGVAIYGGFAGGETVREARNPRANESLLPGPAGNGPCVASSGVGAEARLDGFSLRPRNPDSYAIACSAGSPTITGCRIDEAAIGVACSAGAAPVIAGNYIAGCMVGVNCSTASPAVVDNVIEACEFGVHTGLTSSPVIANNTLASSGNALDFRSGAPTTASNVIALNLVGVYLRSGGTPRLDHNLVWQNANADYDGPADPTGQDGNLRADPHFADPVSSNYRILAASPCIDAGIGGVSTWPTDLDGAPRVSGPAVDIGAYEFRPGADVAQALRIAGGLAPSTPADMGRLNPVVQPPSTGVVDILDAVRLMRQ